MRQLLTSTHSPPASDAPASDEHTFAASFRASDAPASDEHTFAAWCHCQVTDLIRCALSALGSQRAELARVFLDAIVELMRATPSASATRQLLTMVDAWAAEADPSQMRYLLMQVGSGSRPADQPGWPVVWLTDWLADRLSDRLPDCLD
eukprot:364560-Chlamydomonas_euryale.AAC.8